MNSRDMESKIKGEFSKSSFSIKKSDKKSDQKIF